MKKPKPYKHLIKVTLLTGLLMVSGCDNSSSADTDSKESPDLGEIISQANLDTLSKKLKPSLQELEKYNHTFKYVEEANFYVKPSGRDANPIIVINVNKPSSELNEMEISELTLTQTVLRGLEYETVPTGGRSTKKVVIGHTLYDTILLNRDADTIYLVEGEMLNNTLNPELFNKLLVKLSLPEFEEIMKEYVLIEN